MFPPRALPSILTFLELSVNGQLIMLNSEIPGIHSGRTPFYNERLSRSYAHFFRMANTATDRLFFASAEDFLPDGTVRGHWVPDAHGWRPVEESTTLGLLFDKLGGDDALFKAVIARVIELEIPIFGHYGLNRFTGDKWACYEAFPSQHALTRLIDPDRDTTETQIDAFFSLMDSHYLRHDDVAVVKPRWGWESRGLYLLSRRTDGITLHALSGQQILHPGRVHHALDELSTTPYIIQAYVNTREGIPEIGLHPERHDARFIFSIREPGVAQFFQAYVKTPNEMLYYPLEAFPQQAYNVLESVADEVARRFPYGIFSVDIMRDVSGNWYLTELNDQVGFNIDFNSPRDIEGVGQLMRRYLDELYALRENGHLAQYQSPV